MAAGALFALVGTSGVNVGRAGEDVAQLGGVVNALKLGKKTQKEYEKILLATYPTLKPLADQGDLKWDSKNKYVMADQGDFKSAWYSTNKYVFTIKNYDGSDFTKSNTSNVEKVKPMILIGVVSPVTITDGLKINVKADNDEITVVSFSKYYPDDKNVEIKFIESITDELGQCFRRNTPEPSSEDGSV